MNVVNMLGACSLMRRATRGLIAERMGIGVHCQKCARHVVLDPATLHPPPETPVPSLARPLQMHPLRLEADRGAAGMAKPALKTGWSAGLGQPRRAKVRQRAQLRARLRSNCVIAVCYYRQLCLNSLLNHCLS